MSLKIEDLIPGATYMVHHENDEELDEAYHGQAVYIGRADPKAYVPDTLQFQVGIGDDLFVDISQVSPLTQHQGSTQDQLVELHRIAVKLKLYDAADWIKVTWPLNP